MSSAPPIRSGKRMDRFALEAYDTVIARTLLELRMIYNATTDGAVVRDKNN